MPLVISVKSGEQVVIAGGAILLRAEARKGRRIRLTFDGDKDILIDRLAVHERRQQGGQRRPGGAERLPRKQQDHG